MSTRNHYSVSAVRAGLSGRCPRCGVGKLFSGFLGTAESCPNCDLKYDFADSGDGPAIFIMLIVGFVLVGGALAVEILYQPSYWVHAALWLPLGILLPLLLLRPFKATLIALQYQKEAREGRTEHD